MKKTFQYTLIAALLAFGGTPLASTPPQTHSGPTWAQFGGVVVGLLVGGWGMFRYMNKRISNLEAHKQDHQKELITLSRSLQELWKSHERLVQNHKKLDEGARGACTVLATGNEVLLEQIEAQRKKQDEMINAVNAQNARINSIDRKIDTYWQRCCMFVWSLCSGTATNPFGDEHSNEPDDNDRLE